MVFELQNRGAMKYLLLGSAFALSFGCGGDDDDGSSPAADGGPDAAEGTGADAGPDAGDQPDGSPSVFARQIVFPSCAPGDGPAFTILVGGTIDGDECEVSADSRSVRLEIWTGDIAAPMTFSFVKGEANGSAQVCPGGDAPCITYTTGSILVETFDMQRGATGAWALVGEGSDLEGLFDAVWCEPATVPCG
jgi:hypothetical protein